MIPIRESYRTISPPPGVLKAVTRLLSSLPPGHLAGLEAVVLTDSASISKGKTVRVRGRKHKSNSCLGFYYPARRDSAPWIQIVVDNIVPSSLPWFLRLPVILDLMIASTLFHEVGHHLDVTIGSPSRNGESAADTWSEILRRRYFRQHRRWFIRVMGFAGRLMKSRSPR